jgi:hypothetical protein
MSEITELEKQINALEQAHLAQVRPLEMRLKELKRQQAQSLATDIVSGQKRLVTAEAKRAWGCGDLDEVITVDYICFALDRADQEYLAVVVYRGGYGMSTFPAEAVRAMPIVEG